MNPLIVGLLGSILLIILIFVGLPIALVTMFVGFSGIIYLNSLEAGLTAVAKTVYLYSSSYEFTIIPLFILMGSFAGHAGITRELYQTFDKWFRKLPGGLGITTVAACACFGAISGSSVAAAAAMGTIAIPEMRRYNYAPSLATGVVAAGGTLSFLIPPSLGFVFYGMLTEQSIGKLLISGILPGIILSLGFIIIILIQVRMNPSLAPRTPGDVTWKEKVLALSGVWETLLVFLMVMGGIFLGFITPNEAGAIGATALFFIVLSKRRLTLSNFIASLLEGVRISCMIIFLAAGATVFSYFLALSTIPAFVSTWMAGLHVSRYVVLAIICFIYLILGCFLDSLSMMVLTLPVVFPVVTTLGFDPIYFGVVCVIMMEAGLITPPVGLNVYTIAGIAKDVPMEEIFRGAIPFLIAMIGVTALITIFPKIALFLPEMMLK